ncbi:MAG: electron transfer flavoprotein subunit beta/FixA family protein [Candidatus Limivicinus sp.]
MNILVCVKQVPDTEEAKVELNPSTFTVVRENVAVTMNDFDNYALEAGARIKDALSDVKLIVLTMGPKSATNVLKLGLSVSADKAFLVSDPSFAGSDAYATSLVLSEAIKKIEQSEGKIDAIFCGKQSVDGESSYIGAGIAENLGYPQATGCVDAAYSDGKLIVDKETKGGIERLSVSLPCVVTFGKPVWSARYPTIKRKLAANRAVIPQLTAEDLPSVDADVVGAKNAKVKVTGTFFPPKKEAGVIINEEDPADSAKKLFAMLTKAHIM